MAQNQLFSQILQGDQNAYNVAMQNGLGRQLEEFMAKPKKGGGIGGFLGGAVGTVAGAALGPIGGAIGGWVGDKINKPKTNGGG